MKIKKSALYIPTLVSLVSLLYLLATLCQLPEITNGGRITYIFVSLVVSTLPFFYSDKYTNHLVAITAVIYEVGILWLESFIGRKQCLTSFFVFILIYRILYNGTFYDNFSLCLTYTSDVGSISRQKVFWYFDANLMVWTYFFVVLCLQHVFKRNAERIWQHLRLMILLREKLRHEKECNNKLIDAHFPKDILESVEQLVKKDVSEYTQHSATPPLVPNRLESDDSSSKASGSVKQRNFGTFMGKDQAKLIEEALARDVVEKFDSSDSTMRSPELLSKLDHSDRRNAVIVAIKFFSQSLEPNHSGTPCKSSTSSSESILEHRVRDVLYSLTTHLASFYSITPVRRVGGTWIGCIGFFRSAGNELKNCLATLEFCAHIVRLASQEFHTPVALAFEHGSIVGGFVHSPHFDVYGQEVRHVLQMVDCHYDKKVIIGDNVRFLFSQAMHNDSSLDIKLVRTPLSPPWLARKLAECYTLGNLEHFYGPRDTTSDPTLQALLALLQQYQDVQIMELIDRPTLSKRSVSVQAVFNEHSYQSRGYEFGSDIMQPRPDYEALVQQWNVGQTQQQIATRAALQHVTMFDPSCTSCRIYTAMRCLGRFCSGLFGIDKFSSTAIDNPQDFPQYECPPSNDSAWSFASYFDPDCWKEDIGIEFKTSLRERYNMDHDDIVDFLTEQGKSLTTERLDALHVFIEDALYQIVTKVFVFPGILSMFSFDNPQSEDIESKVQSSLMKKQYGETKRERREGDSLYDTLISVCLNRGLEKNYSEAEGGEEEHLGTFGFQYKWFGSFLGSNKYSKVLVGNSEEERAVKMEVARNLTVSIGSNSHGKHSVPILAASAVTMTQNLFTIEETKQMDDVVANNASIKETTPPADTNYTQYHRSWEKYLADSRAAIHHNLLSFMINFMFVVVSWLFLRDYIFMVQKNTSESMIPFIKVFSLHFLLQLTLERVYGRTGSMLMIVLRFLIIILCPRDILFHRIFHLQHNDETYGDMGGDVPLLIFLTFRLPSHFRQSALLSILDGVFCRLILIIRLKAISKQYPAQFAAALVPLALNFAYLAIHYTCFISYLIEHTLLPYSLEQYKEQVIHTRRLLQLFVPEAACKFSDDIFRPHTYRTMSLAAVHVKPSDKLAGFLSAQDFCNIMYNVGAVIDESIAESGLLKVDNFAGVYVAVVAKDAEWDRITGLRVPSNHNARTIMFLRVLKLKLDKFCKRNNIHITVGIGVDEGSAYMGFIGGKHFHFDVESDMRYKVVCMASYNNDAFYLSSRIEDELEKVFPAEELLHTQKCSEQWGEEYWYAIASTFHGVQLNDFTYTGILGKGGYGAVHLVCEKYTSKQYAIKAINLKENAVLSNMMQRECIILQRMNHPNVINLKYAFMANSRLYLVMSYISCGNLKQVVERDNPSLDVLKLWFAELVQAIQYIHSIGIIHRDIKPANCMIGMPIWYICIYSFVNHSLQYIFRQQGPPQTWRLWLVENYSLLNCRPDDLQQ
ncbi:serine/threonine-protein kinase [archaeon]|nr:MAG: serine/threonine-protein kinase [archaeon]